MKLARQTALLLPELDDEDDPWPAIRREMAEEYAADHTYPWIVGFSGGKDSTVVAHLVFELLLSLPRSERRRPVHIVSNDTLVSDHHPDRCPERIRQDFTVRGAHTRAVRSRRIASHSTSDDTRRG